ncbi:phospholipase D-like domain-containing protein [Halalkalicoccus jeotgali]|uniref:phospholipase D-like domain-containing protein n=1 Tax=Halalkalicoccus jeotgali TaxID=413810 RepID=UPI0009DAC5FC|nr:phospholipase D-like domain-containing protein [Halalkalicoccus jeotgali]
MNQQLLKSCSGTVQEKLEELEEIYVDYSREEILTFKDGLDLYILSKVQSDAVRPYLKEYDSDSFWNWDELTDEPHRAWYVFRLLNRYNIEGWSEVNNIKEIIDWFRDHQTIRGEINWSEGEDHSGPMRLFVEACPNALMTKKAVEYFIGNPPDMYPAYNLPIGISAICDYNYYNYEEEIEDLSEELVRHQHEEGYFTNRGKLSQNRNYNAKVTSFAIQALSKQPGYEREIANAVNWLEKSGTYSATVLGLILSYKGPKIPQAKYEWENRLSEQRQSIVGSDFVETSPPTESGTHTTTLRTEVERLIQETENELKICSPYIDMLHEDLIDLSENNESIEIKVLAKPKGDISGNRARLAKSAIEQLNRASNREVRTNYLIHSRIVISDNELLLVSSADFTRDQLVDEFNAGLTTGDEDAIASATNYFDNLWASSDPL